VFSDSEGRQRINWFRSRDVFKARISIRVTFLFLSHQTPYKEDTALGVVGPEHARSYTEMTKIQNNCEMKNARKLLVRD
jgi:hypothetical protein